MASPLRPSSKKNAWKVKTLRSTFGPQCLATLNTSPSCGFGSSMRDAAAKSYVSSAMDRARARSQGGNNSPGPIYKQPSSIGPQHLSTTHSAPMTSFPGTKRDGGGGRQRTPGPGAYQTKCIIGATSNSATDSTKCNMPSVRFGHALRDAQQLVFISKEHDKTSGGRPSTYNTGSLVGSPTKLSTQASVSAAKMGTNPRFRNPGDAMFKALPGPGQYSRPSAAVESDVASIPSIGFPKASRDANKKIFISLDHEKAAYGEQSPGPGTANRVESIGRQLFSQAKTAPLWGFGTGKRSPSADQSGPGPGDYYA